MNKPFLNTDYSRSLWDKAREFLKNHAVSTGTPLTLKSGRKSDFYVDCRVAALIGDTRRLRADHVTDLSLLIQRVINFIEPETKAEAWCPVPLGGVLLLLRTKQSIPILVPRTEQKDHGMKRKVEGLYNASGKRTVPNHARVLMLEDVITTGGSTIAAVETLRKEQLNPIGTVVLVDREEGGRAAIEEAGLEVWSIFTQQDLRR